MPYAYNADMWCDDCGKAVAGDLDEKGTEDSGDTNDYPQWSSDDFESDSPTHCAECGELIGTLTDAGREYVLERLRGERSDVVLEWMSFFGIDFPKDLYTVVFENSDDDPLRIDVVVRGPYADEWCDAVGSLAGSTWECADGPDFCYDSFYWYPGLIEEITAEGFNCDFSVYSEPEPYDLAVAQFAAKYTDYDWHKAKAEINRLCPPLRWRVTLAVLFGDESATVEVEANDAKGAEREALTLFSRHRCAVERVEKLSRGWEDLAR